MKDIETYTDEKIRGITRLLIHDNNDNKLSYNLKYH